MSAVLKLLKLIVKFSLLRMKFVFHFYFNRYNASVYSKHIFYDLRLSIIVPILISFLYYTAYRSVSARHACLGYLPHFIMATKAL